MLTACGIETFVGRNFTTFFVLLQQCLPLAVLKPEAVAVKAAAKANKLQQCLPLAVLKLSTKFTILVTSVIVATVLTACGIETFPLQYKHMGAL